MRAWLFLVAFSATSGNTSMPCSGVVQDVFGTPKPGVVVRLASTGDSTRTDDNGAWALHGAQLPQRVAPRELRQHPTGRIQLLNRRLHVSVSGFDLAGRARSNEAPASKAGAPRLSARTSERVVDTLHYSFGGDLFLTDTLSEPKTGMVRTYDTTWNPGIIYGWFTDNRDGELYRYVTIAGQVWMAENLSYEIAGGFCWANVEDSCSIYGRLYPWSQATAHKRVPSLDSSAIQGICPEGWRLPTAADWDTLHRKTFLPGNFDTALISTSFWRFGRSSDRYGFRALPAGDHAPYGTDYSFEGLGYWGMWWTSTGQSELGASGRWAAYFELRYWSTLGTVVRTDSTGYTGTGMHLSVRCIR